MTPSWGTSCQVFFLLVVNKQGPLWLPHLFMNPIYFPNLLVSPATHNTQTAANSHTDLALTATGAVSTMKNCGMEAFLIYLRKQNLKKCIFFLWNQLEVVLHFSKKTLSFLQHYWKVWTSSVCTQSLMYSIFYLYQRDLEWFFDPTTKCACNGFDKGPKEKVTF